MKVDVEKLFRACDELMGRWGMDYPVGDPIVACDDPRIEAIEQLVLGVWQEFRGTPRCEKAIERVANFLRKLQCTSSR